MLSKKRKRQVLTALAQFSYQVMSCELPLLRGISPRKMKKMKKMKRTSSSVRKRKSGGIIWLRPI